MSASASVKKAIKIYARLKPTDAAICQHEIDKHINDDGSTDDILILNSNADDYYSNNNNSLNRPDAYKFRFTKVFDGHANQEEIFDEMCRPVLESALEGYNSTIFAYGQTGSGKTYTMTGSRQQWRNRGIIPRSLSFIFEKFQEMTNRGYIASAFLSYLEIYNENGYDLLHNGFSSGRIEDLKKVQLLEDAQQQIHMKNLTVHPIKSEDEAMQLLYLGDHNRIIAETPMNEASTRSHCIFTIHLNIREGSSSTVRRSKIHLVDLAGSERLANSNSTGQLFHEARHINLALHYLEQVIVALGESNRSHIPYRNSMMTSILRDSLGGNCMTSMVATLSLEYKNIMETLSTCRFSQRVALVTNAAMLNEETDPMLLIAQLKTENKRLKDIIANSAIKNIDANTGPLSQEEVADCWKLVEKFIADSDDEAILPIPPDMRMVQTCFRCLKMAVQMNKDELATISPDLAGVQFPGFQGKIQHTQYHEDMTREQLFECLKTRDAEIDVLTKMLRPKKSPHPSPLIRSTSSGTIINVQNLNEHGDGPFQNVPSDCEDDSRSQVAHPGMSLPYQHPNSTGPPPFQERELSRTGSNIFHSEGFSDEPSLFDSLFTEGFSESKRKALDAFIKSYKSFDKLKNIQENLSSKKSEVESIETLLRRNHANLNNLKVVMLSSEGGGEEEDLFMREAVESQTQSIQKQERQLQKCREEMKQIEGNLKTLYAQLMCDFEKHWQSMKEFRMKSGIPPEIDFTDMMVQPQQQGDGKGMEVTKGIVKGVGGNPHHQNQFNSSPGKNGNYQQKAGEFYISAAPSQMQVSPLPQFHKTKRNPSKSPGKTAKGKREKKAPQNSPREGTKTPRKAPPTTAANANSRSKAPPATPAPVKVAHSQTPIQLIHHHQHSNFPSERSTENLIGFYTPPQSHSTKNPPVAVASANPSTTTVMHSPFSPKYSQFIRAPEQFENDVTVDKEDDEELLKDLPMTGDATIDQEILSFFKTRQAVFRRINSDKAGKGGGGSGSGNGNSEIDDIPAAPQSHQYPPQFYNQQQAQAYLRGETSFI